MTSPLQITIMAVLVDRQGQPPQERWSLFAAYYKAIYDRELERGVAQSPASAISGPTWMPSIDAWACSCRQKGERADGTEARLLLDKFRSLIDGHLREEGFKGEQLRTVEDQQTRRGRCKPVVSSLVGLESDRGSEIRSLQEFMAAEGLMRVSTLKCATAVGGCHLSKLAQRVSVRGGQMLRGSPGTARHYLFALCRDE